MNTKILIAALACTTIFALSACTTNLGNGDEVDPNLIRIEAVHPSAQTKVISTGFESNDQIGVYVTAEGTLLQAFGNSVNNGLFVFDGSVWTSDRQYFWNKGRHDVYAYYPYQDAISDTENVSFSINEDQSTPDAYSKSDFLWALAEGKQAGTSAVTLKFSHIMSRAIVVLEKSAKYEGEIPDDAEVYIHNVVPVASVDITSGSAGKDNYAPASSVKMQRLEKGRYAAIVVPQMIETRRPIVEVIAGNISYLVEGTISFKQGFQHTIKVTLAANPQQSEIEIGGGIQDWN